MKQFHYSVKQRCTSHFSQRVVVALILQSLQWPLLSHFTGQCVTWSVWTSSRTLLGSGGCRNVALSYGRPLCACQRLRLWWCARTSRCSTSVTLCGTCTLQCTHQGGPPHPWMCCILSQCVVSWPPQRPCLLYSSVEHYLEAQLHHRMRSG